MPGGVREECCAEKGKEGRKDGRKGRGALPYKGQGRRKQRARTREGPLTERKKEILIETDIYTHKDHTVKGKESTYKNEKKNAAYMKEDERRQSKRLSLRRGRQEKRINQHNTTIEQDQNEVKEQAPCLCVLLAFWCVVLLSDLLPILLLSIALMTFQRTIVIT